MLSGTSVRTPRWLPRQMRCAGCFRGASGLSACAALAPPPAVAAAAHVAEPGSQCMVLGPRPTADCSAACPGQESEPQKGYGGPGGGPGSGTGLDFQLGSKLRAPQIDRFVGSRAAAAGAYHCRDFAWEEVRRDVEEALDAQLAGLPPAAGSGRSCTMHIITGKYRIPVASVVLMGIILLYAIAKVDWDSTS